MSKTSLLFGAAFLLASQVMDAQAQLLYPGCPTSWSWSFNSLGQSPCAVAAFLQGACNDGVFSIPNLEPGNSYTGPTGPGDDNDLCKCNTVVYSLMSACDACQGAKWFPWSSWSHNCTSTDPVTTFSHVVPVGTSVQEWAFLDVTNKGTWDPVLAFQVGNGTEVHANHTGTLAASPTPTTTQTSIPGLVSSQLPSSSHGSSFSKKIAAIIGGVVGGLAFIAAVVMLMLWRARIRRRKATRVAAAAMFPGRTSVPLQEKVAKRQSDGDGVVPPVPDVATAI